MFPQFKKKVGTYCKKGKNIFLERALEILQRETKLN